MLIKTKFIVFIIIASITCLLQNAFAYDPYWKEKQEDIFKNLPVKPGDIVNKSNSETVKDLLPQGIVNWIKNDEWAIKIAEFKFDFSPDEQWEKDSLKNKGKYRLAGKDLKYLVDMNGNIPDFLYGRPFPYVDVANDPDGVIKLMFNAESEISRGGSQYNDNASMEWIGENGFERTNLLAWLKFSFWHRPDGKQNNPENFKFMEIFPALKPYDINGIVSMAYRQTNGKRDINFIYIPAIRRVKRLSGANRSDSILGSDLCMDDSGGWSGDNSSMIWRYIGEKVMLVPVLDWAAKRALEFNEQPDGSWHQESGTPAPVASYETRNNEGIPWKIVNIVWIPREVWAVEATPIDPYYAYGKTDIYVDKKTGTVSVKTIYNKAMEYWKTVLIAMQCCKWGDRRSFNTENLTLCIDDKTRHATCIFANGFHKTEPECVARFNDPNVNRRLFTPESLKLWSR